MPAEVSDSTGVSALAPHPIAVTTAVAIALAGVLTTLAFAVPLDGVAGHVAAHVALAIPALGLLIAAIRWWPSPRSDLPAARLSRTVLLAGLGISGGALIIESVGAFGYGGPDSATRINDLAVVHDFAVPLSPVGIMLVLAGAILSVGVQLASRGGTVRSRYLTVAVVLAIAAVVAFWLGALVFDY